MPEYTGQTNSVDLVRQPFFNATFLESIEGNMVFDQFATKAEIPPGASGFPQTHNASATVQSVNWTGFRPLEMFDETDDLAGVNPGTTWDLFSGTKSEMVSKQRNSLFTRTVSANIEMYSESLPMSKLKMATSLDSGTEKSVRVVGDMVGRSLDWLVQRLFLYNAVQNSLGSALFSDVERDIDLIGA